MTEEEQAVLDNSDGENAENEDPERGLLRITGAA